MSRRSKFVIIGAGVAGIAAAEAIREEDGDAQITMVDEEINFPYYRYLLGDILQGKKDVRDILIRDEEFYDEKGVKLRKGQKVLSISGEGKYVYLSNNERLSFDALLITVGRREVIPSHLKKYASCLSLFSSLEDTFRLRGAIGGAKRAILRGKGFNALELARILVKSGVAVTLVTPDSPLRYTSLPDEENEKLRTLILDSGIILKEGEDINRIEARQGRSYRVELLSGESVEGEILFASGGFLPNLECLKSSGIHMNKGVIIDEYLQTTMAGVYAAGDCAEIYHPSLSRYWINLGFPNARAQGVVAGRNMAGYSMMNLEIEKMRPYTIFGRELYARWWD